MMENMTKILIVDDEYLLRQGLKYLCNWEQEGFTIVGEAATGQEALTLTKTLKPDIIISDIVMPEMDGIEFIKRVKAYNPSVQIVVLSSHSNFEYVKTSFKYGVNDYILKPKLNPAELLPLLKGLTNPRTDNTTNTALDPRKQISSIIETITSGFVCSDDDWQALREFFPLEHFLILVTTVENSNASLWQTTLPALLGNYTYCDFTAKDGTYGILINHTSSKSSIIGQSICQLTDQLSSNLNRPHFALSETFYKVEDIEANYNYGANLLAYKFFLEDKVLITSEFLPKTNHEVSFDYDLFYSLIEDLDIEKAKQLIISHIELVAKTLSSSVFSLKTLSITLLTFYAN